MSRLEIKVDGDDVAADRMLKIASTALSILKGIEKAMCKEKGVKPGIRWFIDMQSGFSYGLIALRAEPPKDIAAKDPRYTEVWSTIVARMKGEKP